MADGSLLGGNSHANVSNDLFGSPLSDFFTKTYMIILSRIYMVLAMSAFSLSVSQGIGLILTLVRSDVLTLLSFN
jgi:hypothetical protein